MTAHIDIPHEALADIVRQAKASDGSARAYSAIGEPYGLLPADVDAVLAKWDRAASEAKATNQAAPARRQSRMMLTAYELQANPANIRDTLGDLAGLEASIRQTGLLQPLIVTEAPRGYLIIDGHRRFAAGTRAGLTKFSCTVRHNVTRVTDQVVLMLVANGQRKDLDAVERAVAFQSLVEAGMNQTEVAKQCGVTESMVSDMLTLLTLDDETLDQVKAGKMSAYEAIKLIRDVRRTVRTATGRPQRGRPTTKQNRLTLSEQEAAALSHVLGDHQLVECACPGHAALGKVLLRVNRLRLDDSAYQPVPSGALHETEDA